MIYSTARPYMACILLAAITVIMLASCGVARQVPYFQDLSSDTTLAILPEPEPIVFKPEDKISILVNSREPQLMALFNLPVMQKNLSLSGASSGSGSSFTSSGNNLAGYTVDRNGDIDFPVLGKIHIAGMTREQAAEYIKGLLIENNLIKDPVVTIEYLNLSVSILGEVNTPGRYIIDKDRITILDALSMAGDLTIYGKRENVTVIRQVGDHQQVYEVNLTSAKDVLTSPAYYLQQNDMIYVEPNRMRANQSTVNGNSVASASFWVSIASFLVSLGVLIFN